MSKKSQIGIYFSYNTINIVEQQDGKVFNYLKIPYAPEDTGFGLSKTITDEAKIISLLKEELLKNNIITRDAVLAVLSRDLIIRFFEIPIVPASEVESTVGYEAKKYIPFKLEELVFDYQIAVDKKARRLTVLFVAVKRDIIDRYVSILEQAGLHIIAIEPVFLAALRALKLINKFEQKGPVAVIDVETSLERADITIIEKFYPRFSRDMALRSQTEITEKEAISIETALPKLINEVRISLDYCRRQFPSHPIVISKIILLAPDQASVWDAALVKELEIPVVYVNIREKFTSLGKEFDLELAKAYGASLKDAVSFPLKIDLFSRLAAAKLVRGESEAESLLTSALKDFTSELDRPFIISNILVIAAVVFLVYLIGFMQVREYENNLKKIKETRESIAELADVKGVTFDALYEVGRVYDKKTAILRKLSKGRDYLTHKLSEIIKLTPKGVWLESVAFDDREKASELSIKASVYMDIEQEQYSGIDSFVSAIKNSPEFSVFKDISLGPVSHKQVEDYYVTDFEVNCR